MDLEIKNSSSSFLVDSVCDEFYFWNENVYIENGTYEFLTTNSVGCDSLAVVNIIFYNELSSFDTVEVCDSYNWNGQTLTESGDYQFVSPNVVACDSVANLNLTINPIDSITDVHVACESFTWIDGVTYTENNSTASFNFQNVHGCDSIIFLDLTIGSSDTINENILSCEPYQVTYELLNGEIVQYFAQPQDGDFFVSYEFINDFTCISLYNLNVDFPLESVFSSQDSATACDSFDWNDQTLTESGVYEYETFTQFGCDSLAILSLTINESSNFTYTEFHCDSFTWVNDVTYTQDTLVNYSFVNELGCPSLLSLDLTISSIVDSQEDVTVCNPFVWNDITYNSSGTYEFDTISFSGCDSTAILNLVVVQLNALNISGQTSVDQNSSGNYSVPSNSGSTFEWTLSGAGSIASGQGSNQVSINWSSAQIAQLCVVETDQNGCQGPEGCISVTVNPVSSVMEFNDNKEMLIFPNPANKLFHLEFFVESNSNREISISDMQGRVVRQLSSNLDKLTIQRGHLKPGLYHVKVRADNKTYNQSIILK